MSPLPPTLSAAVLWPEEAAYAVAKAVNGIVVYAPMKGRSGTRLQPAVYPWPNNFRADTLDALYDLDIEGLPERARWNDRPETPSALDDRYVVIAEEIAGDEVVRSFGGCWPQDDDALRSYDWSYGPPVYVVDLWAPPAEATRRVKLTPSFDSPVFNIAEEIA
jgi:hypothetical protein